MTTKKATAWDTNNEIDFLRGLGTWREFHYRTLSVAELSSRAKANGRRQKLLSKFMVTMRSRQNWGEIDRGRIEEYVLMEMK